MEIINGNLKNEKLKIRQIIHRKFASVSSQNYLLKPKEKDIFDSKVDITIDTSQILNNIERKNSLVLERVNEDNVINHKLISETNIKHNDVVQESIKRYINSLQENKEVETINEIQNTNDQINSQRDEVKKPKIEKINKKKIEKKKKKCMTKQKIKCAIYCLFILIIIVLLYIYLLRNII